MEFSTVCLSLAPGQDMHSLGIGPGAVGIYPTSDLQFKLHVCTAKAALRTWGFTSRWTIPVSWHAAKPSSTCTTWI